MNTNHTPAPWKAVKADRGYIITSEEHAYDIAVVRDIATKFDNEANARLIAAAPELLEGLKRATSYLADLNGCDWIKGDDPASIDMRQRSKALQSICFAVIAKATGE